MTTTLVQPTKSMTTRAAGLSVAERLALDGLVKALGREAWGLAERVFTPEESQADAWDAKPGADAVPIRPDRFTVVWPLPRRAYDEDDAQTALAHGLNLVQHRVTGDWGLAPIAHGLGLATRTAQVYVMLGYLPPMDLLVNVALDGVQKDPNVEDYLLGKAWLRVLDQADVHEDALRREAKRWNSRVMDAVEGP